MNRRNLDGYEEVKDRLPRFWEAHPDGRVLTQLVEWRDDQFVVRAELYRDADDPRPTATGYGHERLGGKGANEVAALENCETSAIGRALANWRYASGTAPRPSREEMRKTQPAPKPPAAELTPLQEQVKSAMSDVARKQEHKTRVEAAWIAAGYPARFSALSDDQAAGVLQIITDTDPDRDTISEEIPF